MEATVTTVNGKLARLLRGIWDLLSGLKLAVVLLVLLLLLTWLGTLYQAEHGLHGAIEQYFDAWVVLQQVPLWGDAFLVVPLPGAWPVMILLFVNLLLGGILRARKGWRQVGVLMAHAAILWILVAGFVSRMESVRGFVALYPGEKTGVMESYDQDSLEITPLDPSGQGVVRSAADGTAPVVVTQEIGKLKGKPRDSITRIPVPGAGLELEITGWASNSLLLDIQNPSGSRAAGMAQAMNVPDRDRGETPLGGQFLRALSPDRQLERNIPGLYLRAMDPVSGETSPWVILQDRRLNNLARTVTLGSRSWRIQLAKLRTQLPFELELRDFRAEFYPGSGKPKSFESDVVRHQDGQSHTLTIRMNEPMRAAGYTAYQASWGPQDAMTTAGQSGGAPPRLFSQFEVVSNPAEKWPEYATYLATLGLALHFVLKLFLPASRGQKRRDAEVASRDADAVNEPESGSARPGDAVENPQTQSGDTVRP